MEHDDYARRFGGIGRLYGEAALARFEKARVCVIGVGGVGSWAVEALARSAIGQLTLIDLDNVCASNVNRQLHAITPDFGLPKVTALRQRIAAINSRCEVTEIEDFVTPENLAELLPASRFGQPRRDSTGRVTADGHKARETRRAIEHRRDMLAIERQFRL